MTISNVGDAGLTIYGVTTDNDKFSTTNITSLGAGESANVTVTFAPDAVGPQSGNLTISSDDPDEPAVKVTLSGNGITKPAAPDIAVSPEALDFGDVYVNSSKSLNVTISNVGDAGLTIYGVTTDNDKFSTTNITSLAAGESANVTVTFGPTDLGPQSGNLTISSDDPDEGTVKIGLSGNGIAKPAAPDIAVSPEALDFGDVYVGSSRSLNVTISNVGDAGLTIYGVTTDNDKFSTTNITSLAAGESANVTVTFAPDVVGGQSGNLTISSDDPDEPAVKVTLSGNGIAKPAAPDIAVSPGALDFGDVYVSSSKSLNVTISNVGDAGLTIYGVTTDNDKFSTTNITSLGAGESANVTVTFAPDAVGPQSGNLTISSDDPDEGTVTVAISGNGMAKPAAPDIAVSPEALDFGDVYVGATRSLNVTISNVGDAGLTIYGVTTDNDKFSTTNITSLAAGESANVTVTFAPTGLGPQSGNLTISSDDPDEGTVKVGLSGNGIAKPAADLQIFKTASPDPVAYGENLTYTLTVTNNGPDYATGVYVTDNISPYLEFVAADSANASFDSTTGKVTWLIGDLPSGANTTLEIVTRLNLMALFPVLTGPVTSITNVASVAGDQDDPDLTNNTATTETGTVTTDLEVTKVDSADPIGLTDNFTWTVTVTNNGPADASNVVAMDLYMPELTDVHSFTPSVGSVSGTAPQWLADLLAPYSSSMLSGFQPWYWDIGDLASGASATLVIAASANTSIFGPYLDAIEAIVRLDDAFGGGSLSDIDLPMPDGVLVLSETPDSDFSNNTAFESTTARLDFNLPTADLEITKSGSPDPVAPGDNITYTVTIRNNGPEDATGVFVLDQWPQGMLDFAAVRPVGGYREPDAAAVADRPDGIVRLVHAIRHRFPVLGYRRPGQRRLRQPDLPGRC